MQCMISVAAIRFCAALVFSAVTAPSPQSPVTDPRKLALGERLFHDVRLSADQNRACSSCHDTGTNGADTVRRTVDHDRAELTLNTTTIFNLSLWLSWTGNYRSFEAQAAAALDRGRIMQTTVSEVPSWLDSDAETCGLFREAYGDKEAWPARCFGHRRRRG
jgi:cytochrome c peroxidase